MGFLHHLTPTNSTALFWFRKWFGQGFINDGFIKGIIVVVIVVVLLLLLLSLLGFVSGIVLF